VHAAKLRSVIVIGAVELVPSPYDKYKAPPAPDDDTHLLYVVLPLVPLNVTGVEDPGMMTDTQPPVPLDCPLLKVLSVIDTDDVSEVAADEKMLIMPPRPPALLSVKLLPSTLVLMLVKPPVTRDTAPPSFVPALHRRNTPLLTLTLEPE